MNRLFKIGYFLLGFGAGILVTSYFCEWHVTAPIDEDEEYIPNDIGETDDDRDNSSDKEDTETSRKVSRPTDTDSEKKLQKRSVDTTKVRYSRFFNYSDTAESEMTDDERDYLEYITEAPPDDEPEDDSYSEDDDDYIRERVEENIEVYLKGNPPDIVTLMWYDGDKTLTDDRDEIIPNWEDVVGRAAIHRLAERGAGAEDGVINIRNLKTCVDYEVVFLESKYQETVLGIFESRLRGDGQLDEALRT